MTDIDHCVERRSLESRENCGPGYKLTFEIAARQPSSVRLCPARQSQWSSETRFQMNAYSDTHDVRRKHGALPSTDVDAGHFYTMWKPHVTSVGELVQKKNREPDWPGHTDQKLYRRFNFPLPNEFFEILRKYRDLNMPVRKDGFCL